MPGEGGGGVCGRMIEVGMERRGVKKKIGNDSALLKNSIWLKRNTYADNRNNIIIKQVYSTELDLFKKRRGNLLTCMAHIP